MQTDSSFPLSLSTADDSTTNPISGIDSPCMTKAALYARVSTDAQQKEGTIESQLVELRRQITAVGHALAEEYIDDGYTGTLLDRPALNRMRADLKADRFDRIYFLAADRIAREVEYQRIIVGELLKHGKQITINGKDYEQNPENKLTLTMPSPFDGPGTKSPACPTHRSSVHRWGASLHSGSSCCQRLITPAMAAPRIGAIQKSQSWAM
jgi:Resolvase, N terminal domain